MHSGQYIPTLSRRLGSDRWNRVPLDDTPSPLWRRRILATPFRGGLVNPLRRLGVS